MASVKPFEVTLVGPLELQEYLFSNTQMEKLKKGFQDRQFNGDNVTRDLRDILRLHRMATMSWLMQAGVSIPMELICDQSHPPVGKQFPDRELPDLYAPKQPAV